MDYQQENHSEFYFSMKITLLIMILLIISFIFFGDLIFVVSKLLFDPMWKLDFMTNTLIGFFN